MDEMLAAMGASGIGSGWERMGKTLGSASGSSGLVYDQAMGRQHDLQKKMQEAMLARDENLARDNAEAKITQQLAASGMPAEEAASTGAMLGTVMRAGFGNFDQSTQGLGNLQQQQYRARAGAAVDAGDLENANANLMVAEGKPVDLTKVMGGTAYNPMVSPSQDSMIVAPGQAAESQSRERIAMTTANGKIAAGRERAAAGSASHDLKAAARDAYLQAKASGSDMKGITMADIEYAMKTEGGWAHPDGIGMTNVYEDLTGGRPAIPDLADAMDPRDDGGAPPTPAKEQAVREKKRVDQTRDGTKPPLVVDTPATRSPRQVGEGGSALIKVNSAVEAKAAWEKLQPGQGLQFPNGTIKRK